MLSTTRFEDEDAAVVAATVVTASVVAASVAFAVVGAEVVLSQLEPEKDHEPNNLKYLFRHQYLLEVLV